MPEMTPISHEWTEDDRLRLIYRISEKHLYFLKGSSNVQSMLSHGKETALLIAVISSESSSFLELNRSKFNEYFYEEVQQ